MCWALSKGLKILIVDSLNKTSASSCTDLERIADGMGFGIVVESFFKFYHGTTVLDWYIIRISISVIAKNSKISLIATFLHRPLESWQRCDYTCCSSVNKIKHIAATCIEQAVEVIAYYLFKAIVAFLMLDGTEEAAKKPQA